MQKLYIIKTGSTFPSIAQRRGDFEDWALQGMLPALGTGMKAMRTEVVHAERPEVEEGGLPIPYPDLASCAGVVVLGSHAMVTDDCAWMHDLQRWLHAVCMAGIPVLGICFGHQILAQTLGGQVGPHPRGLELGSVPVSIQADVSLDPLWQSMPPSFTAHVVHYQTVRQLPPQSVILAGNSHEPHQAFRWRHNVWGVQFHPEFDEHVMQSYIEHVSQDLAHHGMALLGKDSYCVATPESAQLLCKFAYHARAFARAAKAWQQAA